MPNPVIQGTADLDIAPFMTALTTLSQGVNTAVTTIHAQMQSLSIAMAPVVASLNTVSNAASKAALVQLRQAQTQKAQQQTATAAAQAQLVQARTTAVNTNAQVGAARANLLNAQAQATATKATASLTMAQAAQTKAAAAVTTANAAATRAAAAMTVAQARVATATNAVAVAGRNAAQHMARLFTIYGDPSVTRAALQLKTIEDALNSIYRAGAQISQTGRTMFMWGAAITGLAGLAIKSAAGFDFWVRRFIAAAQAAGSFKMNVSEISAVFQEITFMTGASAESVAEAASRFEQAMGIELRSMKDVSGVAKILETVIKASTIAQDDAGQIILGITQSLGAYGLGLEDAVMVTMAMSNAAQISRAQLGDLIESIKMTGSVARGLNVDLYETLATISRISDVGQMGSQAGRGLQRFLAGMVDPSKEAAGAWAAVLGKGWREALFPGGQFVGLIDRINERGEKQIGIIGQIYNATKNLTMADREQFLAKITTENAYRVISPLIKAYGEDIAQAEEEARTGIKGTTLTLVQLNEQFRSRTRQVELFGNQWETISKSITVAWLQQLRELEALFQDVGIAAQDALLPIVRNITIVVAGIRAWAKENSELFGTIIAGIATLGVFLLVFGTLGFFLGQTIQGFAVMRLIIVGFIPIVTILISILTSLGWWLVAIVAAVTVLNTVWRTNILGMGDVVRYVATVIGEALAAIAMIIWNLVQIVYNMVTGNWGKVWDLVVDIVITVLALLRLNIARIMNGLANEMWGYGFMVISMLALGMMAGAPGILAAIAGITYITFGKLLQGNSPPKEGPLSEIDQWGENVIGGFAEGVKRGAEKKVKPAAKQVAKEMSKPLEGHSPAKEGPLSEIAEWGSNLMNAMLQGFKKADFSILNEAASVVMDHLKAALDAEKISPDAFIGGARSAKEGIVSLVNSIRQGGELAATAFQKVRSVIGGAADDVETLIKKYAVLAVAQRDVDQLKERQRELKEKIAEEYDKPIEALKNESADLDITKRKWELKKQAIEDSIEKLNRSKEPLQDERQKIQDIIEDYQKKIEKINDAKQAIQDEIDLLEAQRRPIKDRIAAIQEEIQGHRDIADGIRNRISDLSDERQELEDQVELIEKRYDKEKKAAKDAINALRDQLDLLKEQNEEKLKPLKGAAESADKSLDAKKKADKKEEEVLERRIADYRAKGAASYYVDKLQEQLRQLKNRHEDEQQLLQDQKDSADDALDAARKKQDEEEEALQKQIDQKERAEKEAQKIRDATIEKETKNLRDRITAIEKEEKTLEKKAKSVELDIRAAEARLKSAEKEDRTLEKQEDTLQRRIRALEKDADGIQRQITLEERKDKNFARQQELIDRQITNLNRENRNYTDKLQVIEREQEALRFREQLLEQQTRPLKQEEDIIKSRLDAADIVLERVQEEYDIAKAIVDLYAKDRQEAISALKSGGKGWKPGEDADPDAIAKKLQVELEGLQERIRETFSTMSKTLSEEKKKIRKEIDEIFGMPGERLAQLGESIGSFFGKLGERMGREWDRAWAKFSISLSDHWWILWNVTIPGAIEKSVIIQAIKNLLKRIFGSGIIGDWIDDLTHAWESLWTETLPNLISGAWNTLKDAVGNALDPMWTKVEEIFSGIKLFLVGEEGETGLIGGIKSAISLILGEDDKTGLRGIWNSAFSAISVLLFGEDGKTGIVGGIHNFLVGEDGESGLIGTMRKAIGLILGEDDESGLRHVFKTAFDAIKTAIEILKTPIQIVQGLIEGFISVVGNAISKIEELLNKIPGVEGAMKMLGMRHSGGWIPQSGLYSLQQGEYVLSRAAVANLERARGASWQNQLTSGMASLQMGINSSLSAMKPTSGGGPTIVLQIGTLIADDRGLTELERRLKKVRVLRDNRIAV